MANAWGTSWGVSWGASWGSGVSPIVVEETLIQGGGDDDAPRYQGRKRTKADFNREYDQLLARVQPDLLPAEKAMRRLGAKPITAPIKGRDLAGPALVGPVATNAAMQQMRDEEAIMLLMLS